MLNGVNATNDEDSNAISNDGDYLSLELSLRFMAVCDAARSGKIVTLCNLLAENPCLVNATSINGTAPIHFAACYGQSQIINKLTELGAHIDLQGGDDWETPLHFAVHFGHIGTVTTLLARDANINSTDSTLKTPLISACSLLGWEPNGGKMISLLLKRGASVNLEDIDGEQALHFAVRCGALDTVQELLNYGANPNHWSARYRTPLHLAAMIGDCRIIETLVAGGAYPDGLPTHTEMAEANDFPPICSAIIHGHTAAISTLARCGANLNTQVNFNKPLIYGQLPSFIGPELAQAKTPLHYCTLIEHTDILATLLKTGQSSLKEIDELKRTASALGLSKSLATLEKYADYIPPASLKVLSGRRVRELVVGQNADTKKAITQLPIPTTLHRFLLWHI